MTDAVQTEWEYGEGVVSDYLTPEAKEEMVKSGTTFTLIDVVEMPSNNGQMLTYTILDANGEQVRMSLGIEGNNARREQGTKFKQKLMTLNEGEGIPMRLVKKGRAYDFAPPLNPSQPF
jgi:hypothetical protein